MINKRTIKNVLELEDALSKERINFTRVHMIIKDSIISEKNENMRKKLLEAEFCTENIIALPSQSERRKEFIEKLISVKNDIKEFIVKELLKNEEEVEA